MRGVHRSGNPKGSDKSKAKPAGDEPLEAEKEVQRNVDVSDWVDDLDPFREVLSGERMLGACRIVDRAYAFGSLECGRTPGSMVGDCV